MAKYKKITFRIPDSIRHDEARKIIADIVKQLNKSEMLEVADIPQLHRMSIAYDTYLTCVDILAEEGLTMRNLKGEIVKRPEFIKRELESISGIGERVWIDSEE